MKKIKLLLALVLVASNLQASQRNALRSTSDQNSTSLAGTAFTLGACAAVALVYYLIKEDNNKPANTSDSGSGIAAKNATLKTDPSQTRPVTIPQYRPSPILTARYYLNFESIVDQKKTQKPVASEKPELTGLEIKQEAATAYKLPQEQIRQISVPSEGILIEDNQNYSIGLSDQALWVTFLNPDQPLSAEETEKDRLKLSILEQRRKLKKLATDLLHIDGQPDPQITITHPDYSKNIFSYKDSTDLNTCYDKLARCIATYEARVSKIE